MRIHDIKVEVDLKADNPNSPDPNEFEEYDGTTDGMGEGVSEGKYENIPKTSEANGLASEVSQWWTGPWPRLHSKIEYTTDEGCIVKHHISNDLVGDVRVEENMELSTASADDPVDEPNFVELVGDVYFKAFIALWQIELVLIISDIFTVWACAVWEKNPSWWPLAAAAGAIWTTAFILYVGSLISQVINETEDPFVRFWVITLLGISMIFGFSVADFLKDLGVYLIANGIHEFTEFFLSREAPSLTWMLWKLVCTLIVFIMASIVLAMTISGALQ